MARPEILDRVRKALGDRYDVITAVGRGGTASIFGAYDKSGQRVAIKVLHPELTVSVAADRLDRKSTRLNSSHLVISYAVFCLKKKIKPRGGGLSGSPYFVLAS